MLKWRIFCAFANFTWVGFHSLRSISIQTKIERGVELHCFNKWVVACCFRGSNRKRSLLLEFSSEYIAFPLPVLNNSIPQSLNGVDSAASSADRCSVSGLWACKNVCGGAHSQSDFCLVFVVILTTASVCVAQHKKNTNTFIYFNGLYKTVLWEIEKSTSMLNVWNYMDFKTEMVGGFGPWATIWGALIYSVTTGLWLCIAARVSVSSI